MLQTSACCTLSLLVLFYPFCRPLNQCPCLRFCSNYNKLLLSSSVRCLNERWRHLPVQKMQTSEAGCICTSIFDGVHTHKTCVLYILLKNIKAMMEKLEPPHSWVPRVQTERGEVDVDASLFFFWHIFGLWTRHQCSKVTFWKQHSLSHPLAQPRKR